MKTELENIQQILHTDLLNREGYFLAHIIQQFPGNYEFESLSCLLKRKNQESVFMT